MKIGLGSDHKGYKIKEKLKKYLNENGYDVLDYGTDNENSTDYPVYAFKVCENVRDKNIDFGILICGTGIGMSIAANKVKGIRCAKVSSKNEAYLTRLHNNSNVMALGSDLSFSKIKKIVLTYITTDFSNDERHKRRIEMVDNYD